MPVQLTFDGAARWMAGNARLYARLQAHKIESMCETIWRINQASKKQTNENLTRTRYSSAHLDRAQVMAENVWHLGRATRRTRCND